MRYSPTRHQSGLPDSTFDPNTMKISIPTEDDEGYETVQEYDAIFQVCDRCRGSGHHVAPGIDDNGITESEMAELGPEFREGYRSGRYDVTCHSCDGHRVVAVIREDNLTEVALKALYQVRQEEALYRSYVAAERRMGA